MKQRSWWHDLRLWVIVLGLLFAARGIWDVTRALQFVSGIETQARIIGMERVSEGRGRSSSYARVRFTDQAGAVRESETETRVDATRARIGQTVSVRYLPSSPQRVRMADGAASPGMTAWLCLAIGTGLVGAGTFALLRPRRQSAG